MKIIVSALACGALLDIRYRLRNSSSRLIYAGNSLVYSGCEEQDACSCAAEL